MAVDNDQHEDEDDNGDKRFDDFGEADLQEAGVLMDDLYWRVEKLRLEESNIRRFLRAKPVYLPYEECCKWVQAFGRWTSEDEW